MLEPLRIVCVDHHEAEHGVTAQILTDCRLEFSWRCVASPLALSRVTEEFNPHIVLWADDMAGPSSQGLLDALRLLCSQTPVILVSSMYEMDWGDSGKPGASPLVPGRRTEKSASFSAGDAVDLRAAFSTILESSVAAAVMTDAKGSVTHANTGACRLLSESNRRTLVTVLGTTYEQCPLMPHWLPASEDAGQDDAAGESERSRHRLAYVDDWSLLPTLVHMDDLIGSGTQSKHDHHEALALIAMDRDSARIPEEDSVPRYGSIVRLGSDDFLVVLPDPSLAADAATTVHRLVDSVVQSRLEARATLLIQSNAAEPDSGVQHRRAAQSRPAELTGIAADLDDAVRHHTLNVQYQPQFDLDTGRGCGIEALARWTLPSGEVIAPSIFIPIAEREGMIQALGEWILKSACDTAYDWCGRDAQRTTLAVNVSALQIEEEFCETLTKILERSRFPAKRLELEVTERALMAYPDLIIEYLKQWKELGVRIALDNFGTGDSSLSYLSRLPVDTLKLNQSLIHRMAVDKKCAAVTRSIVSQGVELGIDVIAEGVETEEQLGMLIDLGCPRAQGYLLARPMPASQVQVVLRKAWGERRRPVAPSAQMPKFARA
jgi:EAL domain-containing protein (putative c-di-GMP-specific phosphodiesterase class I)